MKDPNGSIERNKSNNEDDSDHIFNPLGKPWTMMDNKKSGVHPNSKSKSSIDIIQLQAPKSCILDAQNEYAI